VLVVGQADDARDAVRGPHLVRDVVALQAEDLATAAGEVVGRGAAHAADAGDDDVIARRSRGHVRVSFHRDRSTAPARWPVSMPSATVTTPLTRTYFMPTAVWFGSKVVPRSAKAAGSNTATSAHAPGRSTPRSPRPSRLAGNEVMRRIASSGW